MQTLSEKRWVGWLVAICRKDIKKESYLFIRVCSDHFKSGKPATLYDTASPDWIPMLNLGHNKLKGDASRHDRATDRATKRRKLSEEQEEERAKEEHKEERRQQEKRTRRDRRD